MSITKLLRTNGEYSIKDTLECGQIFRQREAAYRNKPGYVVFASEHCCFISQENSTTLEITCENNTIDFWSHFLNIEADYERIVNQCKEYNDTLGKMAECGKGIRILNQDSWEMLISFIISQQNKISKIANMVNKISELVGDKRYDDFGHWSSFPNPKQLYEGLLIPEKYNQMSLGYRLDYLRGACQEVMTGRLNLEELANKPYEEVMVTLQSLYGVGPKVANCVALFGLGKTSAFPIDTWIKKAIATYFDGCFNYEQFGDNAGIVQQFIFHYIRNITRG